MKRKILFVINPISGGKAKYNFPEKIDKYLDKTKFEYECVFTEYHGHGSVLAAEAIKNGADVFISSDFTYHKFFDADNKIMIVDIGHYEFEQFTTELIVEYLYSEGLRNIVFSTEINTNPFNYI